MNRRKIRVGLKNILPVMLAGLVLVSFGWGVYYLRQAGARSAQGFDPGNIMSDTVMSDYRTMTVEQIQAFLNSKVPHCDTYGQGLSPWWAPDYNKSGKTERWEWGQYREGVKTFTCLKDYKDSAGRSAAQLIYDKAHKYKINPQVLIVLLQKEQNLVLDTWPMQVQYKTATGYGCPDTAPCDSQYYGLENQLDWSAKMFRAILNRSSGWYTPYRLGINNIRWNPNPACGTSQVNIGNLATVALYSYTPYRPNQAALNAGYGSGDGCSAYGNRNFYLYFTDWFGNIHNSKPKVVSKPVTMALANNQYQYQIKYEDLEGDHVAFKIEKGPKWLKNNNGLLYGTPTNQDAGKHEIRIKVYDYLGSVEHKFEIEVVPQQNVVSEANSKIDFNNDGYSDIAITSAFADGKTFNLWIFPGSKEGFGKPIFQRTFPASEGWNQAKTKFFAGDANGDGYGDLTMLIEKPDGGIEVRQVRGSKDYLTAQPMTLNNYGLNANAGWLWKYVDSIQSPADFNNDGYSDIAITSAFADGKTFNLWIFPGSKEGFGKPIFQRTFPASEGWNQAKTKFFAGDANGDGYGDLTMLIEKPDGGIEVRQVRGSKDYLTAQPMTLNNYGLNANAGWLWKYVDPVR